MKKMNHKTDDYIQMLLSAEISVSDLEKAQDILGASEELPAILDSPTVSKQEKQSVVASLFPAAVQSFITQAALACDIESLDEIIRRYSKELDKKNRISRATVYCVTEPNAQQLEGIRRFVQKEENAGSVELQIVHDDSLLGGFVIQTETKRYDRSLKNKISQIKEQVLENARKSTETDAGKIIAVLKTEIRDYEFETSGEEVGSVISVGDGIAVIHGLDHAMYGEIVVFDSGVKGMVQDIKRTSIGCILFGDESTIHAGSRVKRTHKEAGVPVGEKFIGRIVSALGEPLDGKGEIPAEDYRPVEQPAPSIVDRRSVDTPLATGILSIDSMFPIGRGQRELIIGDRQTGKTSIAIDTILNQKGKDVICIYNAIGQKASTIAKLVNTLEKHGAMDYTIVVCSTASDPASLQYISPYAATAMAEYFMYQGRDCLIVYDDLSKHAVAYRALSLLLERSPGREAYPGDVFYLHSRLLERSSRLSDALGGGSLTALPIIETQAGDLSAYIPTNVISITDGQIFLESDLFFSGMRPAVNVGLSVSRVGGAAQTKAMKKAAGSLRIDLAQFREMEVFTQFSSDLDEGTKQNLAYGTGLMELLKQPLCQPLSLAEMVVSLVAATGKKMLDVEPAQIKAFQAGLLEYFHDQHSEIMQEIESGKVLTDEIQQNILNITDEYKKVNHG